MTLASLNAKCSGWRVDWRVQSAECRVESCEERCGLKVDWPFPGCLTQFVRPPNWPECIST